MFCVIREQMFVIIFQIKNTIGISRNTILLLAVNEYVSNKTFKI
jgi:hypothetical protein